MIIILPTAITADVPTESGNIYLRDPLNTAIRDFNMLAKNHKIYGGLLDRKHIQRTNDITHSIRKLSLVNDVLFAEIDLIDVDIIKKYLNGVKYIGKPVISIPTYITYKTPMIVTVINRIMRVQLEQV